MKDKKRSKFSMIREGWANYVTGDKKILETATERAEICSKCPQAVQGSVLKFFPDKGMTEIQGLKCSICKCPLSTSTRSLDYSCPIGKW